MVAKTCVPVAELGSVGLDVLCGSSDDRVGAEFEVGILQALGNAGLQVLYASGECLIVLDTLLHLLNRKGDMIDGFGFALSRKAVVFETNFAHFIGKISPEGLLGPPS